MKLPNFEPTGNPDLDRFLSQIRRYVQYQGPVEAISGWLADDEQTVDLGLLPANSYILRAHLHVTEAFDSDGSDEIECGWVTDIDAIFTATDVSSTGVKTVTLGANNGFNSDEQNIQAYYSNGGSEPTTGKALVIVEFIRVDEEIG